MLVSQLLLWSLEGDFIVFENRSDNFISKGEIWDLKVRILNLFKFSSVLKLTVKCSNNRALY